MIGNARRLRDRRGVVVCGLSAITTVLFFLLSQLSWSAEKKNIEAPYLFYVSTSSGSLNKAIYAFRFNPADAGITALGIAAEVPDPSFFTTSSDGRFLYAVNAVADYQGTQSGSVSAFKIDASTGKLLFLNAVPSEGMGPCYVAFDKTGKSVLVANYNSGSVAVLPVLADGHLAPASSVIQHEGHGPNSVRQEEAHDHSIETSNDNRFAISADLGTDKIFVYRFDATQDALTENQSLSDFDPGAGPRHVVFHPDGRFVFVITEMGSTVSVFRYEATTGGLRKTQTISTLPLNFAGINNAAEIAVSANGKFVYASNRGHDSIASFAFEPGQGKLKLISITPTGGAKPRHFTIDPTGDFLLAANETSNNVVIFRIDRRTGRLIPTGRQLEVPAPRCIKFVAGLD